nr:type II toxin-antitoxin system HicA family toxin [Microcystis sp. M090S1]
MLRYLSQQGCQLVREGSEHSIWENPLNGRRTAIPRHREIVEDGCENFSSVGDTRTLIRSKDST